MSLLRESESPDELSVRADPRIEILPMAIGAYDHHDPLDADNEAASLSQLLAAFGAKEIPWDALPLERGGDAVAARLQEWAYQPEPASTVLFWVGHGWSDGFEVVLAHARSPRQVRAFGVAPEQVAESVRARQATADGHWAIVVIEACWSSRFVDQVNASLANGPLGADALMLVGVSSDGAAPLGRFRRALDACLQENFRSNHRIELWRLARELDRRLSGGLVIVRRLGRAALQRATTPIAATVSVPLDLLHMLEDVVDRLSDDERRHFLAKAQAAEEGEISWFFQGRERETGLVSQWLRRATGGLLIVTGAAGSGKSALLGHVLVHSLPGLRETLVQAQLIDPLPATAQPPEQAFDLVLHLAGMSVPTFVRRLADGARLGAPPSAAQGGGLLEVAGDIGWLIESLAQRDQPITVLLDALDEAEDPIALAGSVLRPLARLARVRLVVGTRASTQESPDFPAGLDINLLEALGMTADNPAGQTLTVERDDEAVARYVARRLAVARTHNDELAWISGPMVSDVAAAIAVRAKNFLFARLAVYEVIARPELLEPGRRAELDALLDGDHGDLFAAAVARLRARADRSIQLLRALALARGRGVPIRNGIWTMMANALEADPAAVSDQDISDLLANARPYITIDDQQDTTVYRLAHRTFVEHFLALWGRHG